MKAEKVREFFEKHGGTELTVQDINDIKAEAEGKSCGNALDVLWYAIWFAFVIGWRRGYKAAKKESPCQPGED